MRISKLSAYLGVLAVGAFCFTVRADDNPAQAAARIALAKQLFELDAPPVTNMPPASTAAVPDTNVVMSPVNTKEAKAKAKAEKAAAKAKAKQDAADLKAKQEADKKLADQKAAEDKAAAAAAKADADKEAAAEKAAMAAAKADKMKADEQAKKAVEPGTNSMVMATTTEAKAPAPAAQPTAAQPAPAVSSDYAGKDLGLKQIAAPALPISSSKADRLQALLIKYKADQITPDEYHQQRAAILAEP